MKAEDSFLGSRTPTHPLCTTKGPHCCKSELMCIRGGQEAGEAEGSGGGEEGRLGEQAQKTNFDMIVICFA